MTDRAHFLKTLVDAQGNVMPGCVVRVLDPGGSTPVSDTLWTDNLTTTSSLTNPFVATSGVVSFYVDAARRIRLGVTPPGGSEQFFEDLDVLVHVATGITTVTDGTTDVGTEPKVRFLGVGGIVITSTDDSVNSEALITIDGSGAGHSLRSGAGTHSLIADIDSTAVASGNWTIAVGDGSQATGADDVVIGYLASAPTALGGDNVVIGANATATSSNGVSIGSSAKASGTHGTAMGEGALACGTSSTSVGALSAATANIATAVGEGSIAGAGGSLSDANSVLGAVALGGGAWARSNGSVALGTGAGANGTQSTGVGDNSYAHGNFSTALGASAIVQNHAQSVALGAFSQTTAANQIMMGTSTETVVVPGHLAVNAEAINTVPTAGASQTLPDGTTATMHMLTLTAASCALTFPTAAAGASLSLFLKQDGTGSRVVTWPVAVKWAGGTAPTLTTTAGKTDAFSFVSPDGTNWFGFVAGQAF